MTQLITAAEVITISIIDEDMDEASIKTTAIEIAQEEHILPVLGDKNNPTDSLYDEIVTQNDGGSLTAANATLLNDYIKNTLAYYVKYEILEDIHIRANSQGIQENYSQFGNSVSSKSRSDLSKRVFSHAATLRDKMIRYIEDNLDLYPKYKAGANVANRTTLKGGIIFGSGVSKFIKPEDQ